MTPITAPFINRLWLHASHGRWMQRWLATLVTMLAVLSTQSGLWCATVDMEAYESGFRARAQTLVQEVSETYSPSQYTDRGKYSFPKAVARFEVHGLEDGEGNSYIDEYSGDTYHLFHFPFVGLARLISRYDAAPSLRLLEQDLLDRVINYPTGDNYNAWTGEGTENHINMCRTSGYLFATAALEYPELADAAATRQAEMKQWILDWSSRVYQMGVGEWDSSVYTVFNLIGWLNLHDFAPDEEVRAAARAVLDFYACGIALRFTDNISAGGEARGNTKYGDGNRLSGTDYLGWLWFSEDGQQPHDGFFSGSDYIQSVHAATSSYRPPAGAIALGRKQLTTPAVYRNSKPSYLITRPSETREHIYIGPGFTLGTTYTPIGGWTNASYGFVNWKMVMANPDGEAGVVWGNGGMKSASHGRGRNPFDQFVQHENVLAQMTLVPENARTLQSEVNGLASDWSTRFNEDFRQRWGKSHPDNPVKYNAQGNLNNADNSYIFLPADAEVVTDGDIVFVHYAHTFLAVRSLAQEKPSLTGRRLADSASWGSLMGLVMEAGADDDGAGVLNYTAGTPLVFASFEAFQQAVASQTSLDKSNIANNQFTYTNLAGDVITCAFQTSGSWVESDYDWDYGVTEQRIFMNTTDWRQPDWPSGAGHGRMAQWSVNGSAVDVSSPWPMFDGPHLLMDGSILIVDTNDAFYQVDYSGPTPVFSNDPSGVAESHWRFDYQALPDGAGVVSANAPAGILPHGQVLELIATPAEGFMFAGWQGDAFGSEPVTTITMNRDMRIWAWFIPVVETVTVQAIASPAAGGVVSIDPDLPDYRPGTALTITAQPAAGYRFTGWTGNVAVESRNPALELVIDGPLNLTANFEPGAHNAIPVVRIIGIPDGAEFQEGTEMIFAVEAFDSDGTVEAVSFVLDGAFLDTDTDGADGWRIQYAPTPGTYTLTAHARDDWFGAGEATPVTFKITPQPGLPEEVIYRENFSIDPEAGNMAGIDTVGWRLQQPNGEPVPEIKYDGNAHRCISNEANNYTRTKINANPTGTEYDARGAHGHVWMNQMPRLNVSNAEWMIWTEEFPIDRGDREVRSFDFHASHSGGGYFYEMPVVRIDGQWYVRYGDGALREPLQYSRWQRESLVFNSIGWHYITFSENASSAIGARAGLLPDGDLEAFGLYFQKQYAFNVNSLDNFEVVMGNQPDQRVMVGLYAIPAAGGQVEGGGSFLPDAKVIVQASPAEGYTFSHWEGDGLETPGNQPMLVLDADQSMLVAAHFDRLPLWSSAVVLEDGWRSLGWLGVFYSDSDSARWIYHAQHGWMYFEGLPGGPYWTWNAADGWWYIEEALYPLVYSEDEACWLTYEQGTSNPRQFFHHCLQQWVELD